MATLVHRSAWDVVVEAGAGRTSASRWLHAVQVYGLGAVVTFGVLAFGAVENWAVFAMAVGAACVVAVWGAEQILRERIQIVMSPLVTPVLAFGVLLGAQYVTGATAYAYVTRLSLVVAATIGTLFFVAVQVFRSRDDVTRFAGVLAVFGFCLAVLAIVQHLASPGRIYWTVLPPDAGLVFGPYVNRNHFAGCIEMLMPLAMANSLRGREPAGKRVLFAFMAVVMCASVFVSQSRAGSVVIVVELAVLAALVARVRRRSGALIAMVLFVALAAGAAMWVTNRRLLERFSNLEMSRIVIAHDTLPMIATHPWLGWGAGTFESVYPAFQSRTSAFAVDHAHNDYLEALVETGIVGLAVVVWFVAALYRTAWRSLAVRAQSRRGVRTAALIGCTGLLLHSLVDFNMRIPANAALFMVLAAIATGASLHEPRAAR